MKRTNCIIVAVWLLSVFQPFAVAQEEVEFVIPMRAGWNMISAPVIPENNDIETILGEIIERDNLILCQDEDGRFISPEFEFNNMRDWDFHKGYKVRLAENDTLIMTGEPVDPETPIQLIRGWNLIAYFLDRVMISNEAFDNIENHLLLVKNWSGEYYHPDSFEPFYLRPGEGYLVKVDEEVELVWPQE